MTSDRFADVWRRGLTDSQIFMSVPRPGPVDPVLVVSYFGVGDAFDGRSDGALPLDALQTLVAEHLRSSGLHRVRLIDSDSGRAQHWHSFAARSGFHLEHAQLTAISPSAPWSRVMSEVQCLKALIEGQVLVTPSQCPTARLASLLTGAELHTLVPEPGEGEATRRIVKASPAATSLLENFPHALTVNLKDAAARRAALIEHGHSLGVVWGLRQFDRRAPGSLQADEWRNLEAYHRAELKNDPTYRAGAVGCRQSHRAIVSEALARGWSSVLILEDDVRLKSAAGVILNEALKTLPDDWELLFLNTTGASGPPLGPCLFAVERARSTMAYVVRRSLYARLIDWWATSGCEADLFERFIALTGARAYRLQPNLFDDATLPSLVGRKD